MPDFNNLGDVANYAVNLAIDASSVAQSGKIAKAGNKFLKDLAPDVLEAAANSLAEEKFLRGFQWYDEFIAQEGIPIVTATKINVYQQALPAIGFAGVNASGNLGINIDPKDQINRGLLNKPDSRGNAPTFKSDNTKVEIHHVGQNPKGPFKEMHWEDHRGKGVDKINHPHKGKKSQIPRGKFNAARRNYWSKVFDLWR